MRAFASRNSTSVNTPLALSSATSAKAAAIPCALQVASAAMVCHPLHMAPEADLDADDVGEAHGEREAAGPLST